MLFIAALAAIAGLEQTPPVPPHPAPPPPSQDAAAPSEVSPVLVAPPKTPPEPAWAKKLNLDPKGGYARSDQPYLRQRPSNGCKSMAGGSVSPSGRHGVAGGLVCVKPF